MPASSGDGVVNITASLKASLAVGRGKFGEPAKFGGNQPAASLDQQLFATNKQVLLGKLEFEKAPQDSSFQLNQLRNKYSSMNPQDGDVAQKPKPPVLNGHIGNGKMGQSSQAPQKPTVGDPGRDGFPVPERMLYSPDKVCNKWQMSRRPAVGLINMGNTCFLNSVIQCLSHTAPLYNYLMSRQHTDVCTVVKDKVNVWGAEGRELGKLAGFCLLCELERHFRRAFDNNHPNGAIKPVSILQRLKCIAKHFHWGRQEDAHEFLRYVIDCMQKCALHEYKHIPKLDPASKNTTVVHQIFGGYLRSQVLCMRCKGRSNTYDPFLDISLDIKTVPSVEKALEKYVSAEVLGNENAYKCERCNMKVPIQKRFTIHQAPNILTLQLKRFEYHKYPPGKLSKPVSFSEKLNIRPYMSQRGGEPVMYQLYAVLQHFGLSTNSGHYLCHVRAPNGTWNTMNDSQVSVSSIHRVLNSEAYLLFYVKISGDERPKAMKQTVCSHGPRQPVLSPAKRTETKTNGSTGLSSDDIGTAVNRKTVIGPQLGKDTGYKENSKPAPKPSSIPSLGQREKIAFGIKPTVPVSTKEGKDESGKPRIVLHIKQGKVAYNSVAHAGVPGQKNGSAVNGMEPLCSSKLVPYQDDESNSDEEINKPPLSSGTKSHAGHNFGHSKREQCSSTSVSSEPVLDENLNATLTVPGAYKPLDQEIRKLDLGSIKRDKSFEVQSPVISPTKEFRLFKESKTGSPQRLTVVTSPVPSNSKLNSTTPWSVLDQDAQVSPSLASGSSNTSVNSTTDWQVFSPGEGRKPVLVPEAQCPGWTVTPGGLKDGSQLSHAHSPYSGDCKSLFGRPSLFEKSNANCSGDGASLGPSSYLDVDFGKVGLRGFSKLRRSRSDTNIAVHKSDTVFKYGENNDSGFVSDDLDAKSEKSSNGSSKCSNGHDSQSPKSNATTDSGCPKSINYSANSAANSSVNCSPDPHLDGDAGEDGGPHHKKHKKKKHKKHKHKDTDSSEDKHKKKKKKHKRKHEDRESLQSSDSSDSPKKQKLSLSGDEQSDSNGGEEYVWVEKTKETLQKGDKDEASSPAEVPTQDWDHHSKARKWQDGNEDPNSNSKADVKWDGSKNSTSDAAEELQKAAFSNGYGGQVNSWEGGQSYLDQEVQKEHAQERKRHWTDDYEEELDTGKSKKMKRYDDCGYSKPQFNQFQTFQDRKNKGENFRRKGGWFPQDRDRERCEYGDRSNYHYNHYRNGGNPGFYRNYQNHWAHHGQRGGHRGGHRGGGRGYHHGNYYGNRYQGNHRGYNRFH